jgi:RNA polymerase sigma-70 factor (ECF subfamily)
MYEEKSTEQIAAQVGLSENATRQLIFRARAAFKKALIGDVDTTGMSAAAILSVAARKAASEGKKVGAAALTLIALVVMSLTVFPGLNRATTDQMAEAPASPGSSQESGQTNSEAGSVAVEPMPEAGTTDSSSEAANPEDSASDSASQASAGKTKKEQVEAVLSSPTAGAVFNSDVSSRVFAVDQSYTAIGDNGITARFNFNPSSEAVFSDNLVEVEIDGFFFEFEPVNRQLITGKNAENLDVYILVGDATYIYDEFGKKWSESDLGQSRVKIEVVMESNGTTVKSIGLALFSR